MKILLVNKFHYVKGGAEKYYFELGKLLKEHGNEVAYFSMKDDKNIHTGDKEYFVEPIELNNDNKLKAFEIIYSKKNYKIMRAAIEEFKPDIIHLNNFQRQLSASIVEAAYDKEIPMVFTTHDMQAVCPNKDMMNNGKICNECIKKGYSSCIRKKCIKDSRLKSILGVIEMKYYKTHKIYEKINCLISPSTFMKNNLINNGLRYNRFEVIHNFVKETLTKENSQEEFILFFGRLSKEKGIFNLLKAINEDKYIKLKIAGTGPEKPKIEKYIKDNKLENRVEILGFMENDKIKDYIKKCSFVVVPSIWYENCPYSILETLEVGKPVIASRIGGIPELVEDNVNGFLYKYDDYKDLEQNIKKLYYNRRLIEKMSKNSRIKFEREFSEKVYYDKIMNLYKKIILESKNV